MRVLDTPDIGHQLLCTSEFQFFFVFFSPISCCFRIVLHSALSNFGLLQCAGLENSGIRNSRFTYNAYSIAAVIDPSGIFLLLLAIDITRILI